MLGSIAWRKLLICMQNVEKEHPTKLNLVAINLIASHLQLTSEGSLCQIVQIDRLQELLWSAEGSHFFLGNIAQNLYLPQNRRQCNAFAT